MSAQVTPETDTDDWYGLEETLEISIRERAVSNSSIPSVGESSKVKFCTLPYNRTAH